MPRYVDEHFTRLDDRWDPETNPDGYVSMCIAENKLVWDLLAPKMAESRDVPARVTEYDAMTGSQSFRQALARFLERSFLGRMVDPDQVVALAGSGTVLEMLFYALADRGDAILIPTPSYAGFWMDLETRDELKVVPVPTSSDDGFTLTTELLDAALAAADRPVRALLFTTPNNPLGTVYTPAQLEEIVAWAEQADIHLVLDELFALSVYGSATFTSAASLRPSLGDKTHLVWAFSKDFAASGLRCGVLVSENEDVVRAVDGLAYWSAVSGDTQFMLEQLISDDDWVAGFVAENRRRLGAAYVAVTSALEAASIPYLPAQAGFFFLCDMRRFMPELSWEAEQDLWRWLLETVNVPLTPGADCHIGEPGFMRLVFASEPTEAVVAGIDRMGKALATRVHAR